MSRIVLWTGPVNLMQVPGATVPGAVILNVQCTGDGTPNCAQMVDVNASGRSLWSVVKDLKPDDEVFIGAFSAGGSVAKRVVLSPEDIAQTRAVMLADATYTSWASSGVPLPPEGFVLFGLAAITGPHFFVATSSSFPNKDLPSGSQTLDAIRKEIERRSGQTFEPITVPGISPQPVSAWKLGNNVFLDYQTTIPHADHAKMAPQLWQSVLQPWLLRGDPAPPPVALQTQGNLMDSWGNAIVLGLGIGTGFLIGRWLGRKKS